MNLKTFAWPASILLTAWLSCVVGISMGQKLGVSNFHNEQVRNFQLDLAEAAQSQDARTRELLTAAGNLAGAMVERKRYEEDRTVFLQKVKELEPR